MQTFLPYPSFISSAEILDRLRLGNQRKETKQIMLAIENPTYGWQHHPAVNMWRGYEPALALYGVAVCTAWIGRGYKDRQMPFFEKRLSKNIVMPFWFGDKAFHLSHQSALLQKDFSYYSQFFKNVDPTLPYVWPV
jgi:hypothetical protein